jgi:phosphoribosylamine-glycine ligase
MGNKNILLIGKGAVISALAKKLHSIPNVEKIFAAPGNGVTNDVYENIDIREDDLTGLLKFALDNNIDLTIPTSNEAFKSDIVSFFQSNGQNIFAPAKNICNTILNKIQVRKFLYKNNAKSPKFGIFNKFQTALDYLKTSSFPVLIKSQTVSGLNDDKMICPTMKYASDYIETLFNNGETDIIIEDYIYGTNFTIYYFTDGYSALPITAVANMKFATGNLEGDFTDGVGSYAPDYRISNKILQKLEPLVNNILVSFDQKGTPYIGILGVECILTGDDEFLAEDLKPFFQNHDCRTVLNILEDDIIEIIYSCLNGAFSDEYNEIKINNLHSITAIVSAQYGSQIIENIDCCEDIYNIDFNNVKQNSGNYYTNQGACFAITRTSKTLTRAKEYLEQDLSVIKFNGMNYRKDICNNSTKSSVRY